VDEDAPHAGRRRRSGRWWFQAAVVVLAVAGLAWFVVTEREQVARAFQNIRDIDGAWLAVGIVTSILSIVLFAGVRSVLLGAGGAHLGLGTATAASFASGAVAATVPAGGAIATAYMVQRYRDAGADAGLAGWTTVASGVVAPSVLVFMTLTGMAIAGEGGASVILPSVVALALLVGFFWVCRRPQVLHRPTEALVRTWHRITRRTDGDSRSVATQFVDEFGRVRASPARWASVWGLQVVSWLGEFATLVASIIAVGGTVPWTTVLAVYGTCQLAGAIPLIPGGTGQVEAALVIGLTASGMDASTALATSVVFRLASHWLVVPIGWVCLAVLRRGNSGPPEAFEQEWN
jgi:putative heme transporter